jgi:hypothetical protein
VLAATRTHLELYRSSMGIVARRPRLSTGACRPRAGSTVSPTSMGAFPPTRRSTCAAPPSTPPSGAVSTGASWPASC